MIKHLLSGLVYLFLRSLQFDAIYDVHKNNETELGNGDRVSARR